MRPDLERPAELPPRALHDAMIEAQTQAFAVRAVGLAMGGPP